jgi:predicted dehydrogenase
MEIVRRQEEPSGAGTGDNQAAEEPLRIAFIGCGRIVERYLAEGWAQLRQVALTGWWSQRIATAEARRAQAGCGEVFSDWRTMLNRVRPDAVLLAVPPFAHGTIETELISRHIPFLVEKPVGLEVASAKRLEAAISAADLVVGVGYNARFTAGVIRAKEALAGQTPILVRGAEINDLARTPAFAGHWWIHRALSGGQLVEQTTHHIDLVRYLLDTEVRAVQAMSVRVAGGRLLGADVEDAVLSHLSLANGAVASFTDATVIAPGKGHSFEVLTPNLRIELIGWNRAARLLRPDGSVETVPAEERNFTRQLLAFIASVRAGRVIPPLATYADGVKALEVAAAVNAALSAKQTQYLSG